MDDNPPRVLVDTNVWVSALINVSGAPAKVLDAFLADRFVPVVSDALLDEVRDVLYRPRIYGRWKLHGADVANVLALLKDRTIEAIVTGSLHLCRDPDDDILLESAVVGGARYFVTRDDDIKGDEELRAQLREQGVEVLSVAQFLNVLAEHST